MAGDKMLRLSTPEELFGYIKSAQDTAFVTNGLAKTNLDEENEVLGSNYYFSSCYLRYQLSLLIYTYISNHQ